MTQVNNILFLRFCQIYMKAGMQNMETEIKVILERHGEQIKTLFKRVDDMNDMKGFIHSLDKNMALQTQLLQSVKDNMDNQHEINLKVNDNLTKLSGQYNELNNKVDLISDEQKKLAEKVKEDERKNIIDLRELKKKKYTDLLLKYAMPASVALLILEKIIAAIIN
ncbi:MAG: hypothetical protein WAO49_09180 [Arcanobacterium sp.]